jgi:Ca2+-binding RTX toxin-like protein
LDFLLFLPVLLFGGLLAASFGGSDDTEDAPAGNPEDTPAIENPPDPNVGKAEQGTSVGEELAGTTLGDLLLGLGGPDTIEGLGGDDVVVGEFGYDMLTGDAGNDIVLGGSGNDLVDGAEGQDLLIGGAGDDTVAGGDGNDLLFGSSGIDSLRGGDGDDTLVGLEYDEIAADLTNTAQALQADIRAAFGNLVTQGQLDRVSAAVTSGSASETGADVLEGGLGNDLLIGDAGDTMTGGAGTDGFGVNYAAGDTATTITDFDHLTERLVLVLDNPAVATITVQASGTNSSQVLVDGRVAVRLMGQIAADLIANQDNWLRLEQA